MFRHFFQLSGAGTLAVADDGSVKFTVGAGKVRSLKVDLALRDKIVDAFVEMASAKPVQPVRFQRPANVNVEKK